MLLLNHGHYILTVVVCFCVITVNTQQSLFETTTLLHASQKVFITNDQSYLAQLNTVTSTNLLNQLKRVTGVDPATDFNITVVRELPDTLLTQLLLLAILGNFTSGASQSSFQQPCRVVLDPSNGLFQLQDDRSTTDQILSVFVIILCVVQLKHIIDGLKLYKTKE